MRHAFLGEAELEADEERPLALGRRRLEDVLPQHPDAGLRVRLHGALLVDEPHVPIDVPLLETGLNAKP